MEASRADDEAQGACRDHDAESRDRKTIHASSFADTVGPDEANDGDFGSSRHTDEGQTSGWLEVDLGKQVSFNVVSLAEPVGRWNDYQQSCIRSYRSER